MCFIWEGLARVCLVQSIEVTETEFWCPQVRFREATWFFYLVFNEQPNPSVSRVKSHILAVSAESVEPLFVCVDS